MSASTPPTGRGTDAARRPRTATAPSAEPVTLSFAGHADAETLRDQLSGVVQIGDALWLGSDEGSTLERLTPGADGAYGAHASFRLADVLDLPDDDDEEVDVEGIDVADGWLWVVGSHAARRSKPRDGSDVDAALERLARVRRRGNRYLLARIPVSRGADGRSVLARETPADDPSAEPRVAARLEGSKRGNALTHALRHDEHLADFLCIPGKDNGLDVEGLAVGPERVFVGLRGPVLRGWAVVLGLRVEAHATDPSLLRLRRLDPHDRKYDKHFLDLRGLGVRELCVDGDDLLVLAGPSMVLDGRAAVFRWRGGARAEGDSLVRPPTLEHLLELPYGVGGDEGVEHPEGLAIVTRPDGRRGLLVVYDAPHAARHTGPDAVTADFFELP
jgi:hypothetical protein